MKTIIKIQIENDYNSNDSHDHQNDYFVSKFEVVTNKGKKYESEAYDYTNFSITNIEFPNADEVLKEYLSIYGKDYDEVVINVD